MEVTKAPKIHSKFLILTLSCDFI